MPISTGLPLTWLLWERMPKEEPQHFRRGVRSSWISVGADRAASCPCVSSSVDVPVLKDSAWYGSCGYPLGGDSAFIPKLREQILGSLGLAKDNGFLTNMVRDPIRTLLGRR